MRGAGNCANGPRGPQTQTQTQTAKGARELREGPARDGGGAGR